MKGLLIALVAISTLGLVLTVALIAMPKDQRVGNEATAWLKTELAKDSKAIKLDARMSADKQKTLREKLKGWSPITVEKTKAFSRVTTRRDEPVAEVTIDLGLKTPQGDQQAQVLVTRTKSTDWSILEWN